MSNALRFTETMTGFVSLQANGPQAGEYEAGFEAGQRVGMECTFTVTIRIPDVDRHISDPDEWAVVHGTLYCPAFGGHRHVSGGKFKLFDNRAGRAPIMRYRLPFHGADGKKYELVGSKHLGEGRNPWKDTTSLKTEIRVGHATGLLESTHAGVVAAGLVKIKPMAFARQLTTMRTGARAGRTFGSAFATTLADVYGPGTRAELASAA